MKRLTLLLAFLTAPSLVMAQTRGLTISTKSEIAKTEFEKGWEAAYRFRSDLARSHFGKALEADPSFALPHLGLAFVSKTEGDMGQHLSRAKELGKKGSQQEQDFIDAFDLLFHGNLGSAKEKVQGLTRQYPKVEAFWSLSGDINSTLRDHDAAIEDYKKVLDIHPEYPSVYNSLGYLYRGKGDYDKAKEAFIKYTKLLPDDPNPHDSLADLYMTLGEYDNAIASYGAALKADPKFDASATKIATCYQRTGRYDQAITQYTSMLESFNDPAVLTEVHRNLADLYANLGQVKEALRHCYQAEKLNPDPSEHAHAWSLLVRAGVWRTSKNYDKARALAEAAFAEAEGWELLASLRILVFLQAEAGEADKASALYSQLEDRVAKLGQTDAQDEQLNFLRGKIALEKSEYELAVVKLKKAHDLAKSYPMAYRIELAKAYFKSGDLASAASTLRPLLDENPNDTKALLVMADIHTAQGHTDKAMEKLKAIKTVLAKAEADFPRLKEADEKIAAAEALAKK